MTLQEFESTHFKLQFLTEDDRKNKNISLTFNSESDCGISSDKYLLEPYKGELHVFILKE